MLAFTRYAPAGDPEDGRDRPSLGPPLGPPQGPPLVIAHGLFGSSRNWAGIARSLAAQRPVLAVDMRNHGQSPRGAPHDYAAMAADLAEVIDAEGAPADVLGHSMGGKAAMMLALRHPGRVRRLVVGDIAPVAYAHTQQALIDAMRAVDLARISSRSDAEAQLAARVPDPGIRGFLLQSLDMGRRAWRLNLDQLEADMPAILGWDDPGGRFDGPVLMLSGALSDYVRPEHRATIRARFPAARFARLSGAGHWLHADRPAEFTGVVGAFLAPGGAAAPRAEGGERAGPGGAGPAQSGP